MRVLIVDDDETFCQLLAGLQKKMQVVWTTDGLKATTCPPSKSMIFSSLMSACRYWAPGGGGPQRDHPIKDHLGTAC